MGEASKKSRFQRVGLFRALSPQSSARGQTAPLEACPTQVPTWIEKNYECSTNPHIAGSSLHAASLPVPSCCPVPLLHLFWDSLESQEFLCCADICRQYPAGIPHDGQTLSLLSHPVYHTSFCPSPHHPHMWQVPTGSHPCLSLAPSLQWGWQPLHAQLDVKPILSFLGLMSLGHFKIQNGSSGMQMLWGECRGTPYCSSSDAKPSPHHTHTLMHILNQLLQRGPAWWSASWQEQRNSWGLILPSCEFSQLPSAVHPSVSPAVDTAIEIWLCSTLNMFYMVQLRQLLQMISVCRIL